MSVMSLRTIAPRHGLLVVTELRLFLREPAAVITTSILPVAALIVLGCVPAIRRPSQALGGMSYLQAYLPVLMMITLAMLGLAVLPVAVATDRERGILRRLSTTPMSPVRWLTIQMGLYLAVGLLVSAVLMAVGVLAFGVAVAGLVPAFVLTLILVAAALFGIGLLIASVAGTARIANGIGVLVFFPLMFCAGLWLPRAQMPTLLRTISGYTPLGAGVDAVQRCIDGMWPTVVSLAVMAGYGVVSWLLAVGTFRWQ